jgi:predicted acetyltransferase
VATDRLSVNVLEATVAQKPVVRHLLELYDYDFSEIEPFGPASDVDEGGLYGYQGLDAYWTEPNRFPFLFRVGGRWAGLALVVRRRALLSPGEAFWMAEFFVMRKYRRRGVGASAATQLFARFPGRWEVGQVVENTAAQAFWRDVIGRYTGGRYREVALDEPAWQGPVQTFEGAPAAGDPRTP